MDELDFDSNIRHSGDFAGVYEYDDGTGYFYLCKINVDGSYKITNHIHILSGQNIFEEGDLSIVWDQTQEKVGLTIHGVIWAIFDLPTSRKFGGDFDVNSQPNIPLTELASFGQTS